MSRHIFELLADFNILESFIFYLDLIDAVAEVPNQLSAFILSVYVSRVRRRGDKTACFTDFNTDRENVNVSILRFVGR